MTVLLTGASGFVGGHIARALVEAGHEIRCALRPTSDARAIEGLSVERVPFDLESPDTLAAVEGADVIVHAAGATRARRPGDYHRVNAEGTRRLAEAAAEAGARRFVFIGSLAARGPDAASRDGLDRPASDYGRSKLEAERFLRRFEERMEVVVLRPAAVYGPRDEDLLPLFKMARAGFLAVPAGPGLLQPVYAGDVASAVLAAVRGEHAGFGPHPVAEGRIYGWKEVARGLEGALGGRVRAVRLPAAAFTLAGRVVGSAARAFGAAAPFDERRAEDLAVHSWTCDVSGTEEALGWRAEVPLFEGLDLTARWYRRAGWLK